MYLILGEHSSIVIKKTEDPWFEPKQTLGRGAHAWTYRWVW